MGLNRLISLSKSSVLPELKSSNSKSKDKISNSNLERQTEKCKKKESSAVEEQKIDKTLKNGKSAIPTKKKSMLWNLRITNKSKTAVKKGKIEIIKCLLKCKLKIKFQTS
jgi:hypothetical protein